MRFFVTNIVVFLCWAVHIMASASETAENPDDLLSLYNGHFNNSRQVRDGQDQIAFLQLLLIPLKLAEFHPATVVFNEFAVNSVVQILALLVISEGPGSTIVFTINNLTEDPSAYRPGEFDVSTLRNLTYRDLGDNNCTAVFKRLNKGVYVGTFDDCTSVINGNQANFDSTVVCDAFGIIAPPTQPIFSKTPYILERTGDRFPLPGRQDNYKNICSKSPTTPIPRTTTLRTTTPSAVRPNKVRPRY